ncbi:histone H1-like [Hypanus sabinus]|uniref:histone H1-like n=1 Tax=Hypanus sabinus TaxID=79690 RepID=UPI0028C4C7AC|nr:histone H1-like [Hypanus sabinus]
MAESHKVKAIGDPFGGGETKAMALRKKRYFRKKGEGPTVTERILSVAAASKQRRGISLAALKKALSGKGYDVNRHNNLVNQTVRRLVKKGSLVKTSGTGASGSFRFNRSNKGQSLQPARASALKKAAKITSMLNENSLPNKSGRTAKEKRTAKGKSGLQGRGRRMKPKSPKVRVSYARKVARGRKGAGKGKLGRRPVGRPRKPYKQKVASRLK